MTRIIFFAIAVLFCNLLSAQNCYWVMLADKSGTTFDPYSYFDAKAIERYQLNNADLYDISNYPLNASYVQQVYSLATEEVGESRWFNAVAVMATPEQIAAINKLPFVKEVVAIESNMHLSGQPISAGRHQAIKQSSNHCAARFPHADIRQSNNHCAARFPHADIRQSSNQDERHLHNQLTRMGGKCFRAKGINGRGVRIAIFDGGFPQVNTHVAFKHLRDNGQIIKTWNFPNKKEDVYGWNSHGLMTFSCIAGREGNVDLGLATGADFLLARTEVEAEPFKEEIWWQMAVEWADKNGAQIISSSLGYGKDRYYTKDMNGQSYVAKAANMAVRKGILVCNSAGNEGDDNGWYTIITPADADSVLCVGGIMPSLSEYNRTSFSSYGPTADGRQKPNVTAFAYARTANVGSSNNKYTVVPGTSFSCPLVAGFAACAMQSRPGVKAMDLFREIEKSADLYPYCDYTYGYGVPQADYFTGDRQQVKPTFKFERNIEGPLRIVPLQENGKCYMFVKNCRDDGSIVDYRRWELDNFNPGSSVEIDAANVVTVNLNGYTETYRFSAPNVSNGVMYATLCREDGECTKIGSSLADCEPFTTRLKEKNYHLEPYVMLGLAIRTDPDNEIRTRIWSPDMHIGFRYTRYFTKSYGWGVALDYDFTGFRFKKEEKNQLDQLLRTTDTIMSVIGRNYDVKKHRVNLGQLGFEVYQRIRFVPGGMFHKGWHWDVGVYGTVAFSTYKLKCVDKDHHSKRFRLAVRDVDPLDHFRWNWGITTRFSRDWLGIYARYRMNGLGKSVAADEILLPRLEVGLQFAF